MIKFLSKDVLPIRKWLSENFWQGHRWLCFKKNKLISNVGDLKCFDTFGEATNYCAITSSMSHTYKIRVLGDTLKLLNAGLTWDRTITSHNVLKEVLLRYPISSYLQGRDLIEQLIAGEVCPVLWKKIIHPLKAIQTYYIIDRKVNVRGKVGIFHRYKIWYQHNQFEFAIDCLRRLLEDLTQSETNIHEFILVGELQGRKLSFKENGELEKDSGILVFGTTIPHGFKENERFYQLNQIVDVMDTKVASSVVFCRFNLQKTQLTFFDERLRRIMPGKLIEPIDLIHYDFEGSVTVVGGTLNYLITCKGAKEDEA